jgi:tetratricopeptide (TPR) repeat protein
MCVLNDGGGPLMRLGSGGLPSRAWALPLLAALTLLMGTRIQAAQAAEAKARALYESGLRHYRAGEYDQAIENLKDSYQVVPAPGLLYDLAQAYRLKGDCREAQRLYRQFLDQAVSGPVTSLARSHLAEMDRCMTDAQAVSRAGGSTAPTAEAGRPADGPSAPVVLSPGLPAPAPSAQVAPDLITAHSAPAPAPRSRLAGRRAALAVGLSAAGLAAAAGYFAWQAGRSSDQVSGMFLPGRTWGGPGIDAEQAGHADQTLGIVTAAGAILGGGIALWLAAHR